MDYIDPSAVDNKDLIFKNDCGQVLLKIAASGSAILAELQRLANHIPDVFLFDSSQHTTKEGDKKNQ